MRTGTAPKCALLDHFEMPIRYGNGLGHGSDAVPKRLNVFELFLDGEIVKAQRRI